MKYKICSATVFNFPHSCGGGILTMKSNYTLILDQARQIVEKLLASRDMKVFLNNY